MKNSMLMGSLVLGAMACAETEPSSGPELATTTQAVDGSPLLGHVLFNNALPHTNGRSCATCHVADQHFALSPANVEARLAANPSDPLFHALDADDPEAEVLGFEHLKRGLVRVVIPLADNLDVVDAAGNVITNPERTIFVWRGVPSVENVALTAPYQFDGRKDTLQEQALGALQLHSQIAQDPPAAHLDHIAAFQEQVFSSLRIRLVAFALEHGLTPPSPDPILTQQEQAGREVFQRGCAACHGGARGVEITNVAAHDQLFFELEPDGSMEVIIDERGQLMPATFLANPPRGFLNIGVAFGTGLAQLGLFPDTLGVDFPRYRLRFYTDATRTQVRFNLPPPVPLDGPNRLPQEFTVDPGLAATTGDPAQFEAFDVAQLRGIRNTAPYFHDNSAPTLEFLVDFYSQLILPAMPALGLPLLPPQPGGFFPESFTQQEKADLIAYLLRI